MANPPLWSPRFQVVTDGDDTVLQYKPFPAYRTWLEAWRFAGGAGGAGAQYPKHAYVNPFAWQWTQGDPETPEIGTDPYGLVCIYSTDNPNTRKFSVTLQYHEVGYYAFMWSGTWSDNGGIAKLFINGNEVAAIDTYDAGGVSPATFSAQFLASLVGEGSGLVEIEMHCDSKNASSGGYEVRLGQFMIYPYDF